MMERSGRLDQLPFPYSQLPLDTQPLSAHTAVDILAQLLEDNAALASTIYAACLSEDVETQDIAGAVHVLAEQLRATVGIWQHWQEPACYDSTPTSEGDA